MRGLVKTKPKPQIGGKKTEFTVRSGTWRNDDNDYNDDGKGGKGKGKDRIDGKSWRQK